jgi:hypothetical protein
MPVEEMTIGKEGAQLFKAALSATQVSALENALAGQPRDHAGVRLSGIPELRPFLSPAGPVGKIPASLLGPHCLPVRAILFDKSAEQNWFRQTMPCVWRLAAIMIPFDCERRIMGKRGEGSQKASCRSLKFFRGVVSVHFRIEPIAGYQSIRPYLMDVS